MIKWMVFWIIVNAYNVPCPQAGPTIDEFGIVHSSNSYTLQLCWDVDKKEMKREFETLEDAKAFVDKGLRECGKTSNNGNYMQSACKDFRIVELRTVE